MSEREIRAHDGPDRVHAPHEDLSYELVGRHPRELVGEFEHDEHVDVRLGDQRRLAFDRGQQPGHVVGCEDLTRVPVEGDRDRAHTPFSRTPHGAPEHGPMPEVHAVEEPDGDDRRLVGERQRIDPSNDLHRRGA